MEVIDPLEPIYNNESEVLILGTMPSVKSRELKFYYANPKNRFWWVMEQIFNKDIDSTIEDRKNFLLKHHIALFDCLKSCDISSSKDSSIKNPIPNDLSIILANSNIKQIFTTGKKAYEIYNKLIYPNTKLEAICLPSTSPANSPKGIEEKLIKEYSIILDYIDK